MEESIYSQYCTRWFWRFIITNTVIWILVPAFFRYALPHDTIEGALWGQHLEWGYDKNPWMNAWLTRLGLVIGGTSGIGIYALSQLFVGIAFWSVWKLASKILPPVLALISSLILFGCVNYTVVPQSFNDNLIELGLWPLLFLFFYDALKQQKISAWLGVGIVAGLSMMAKYYSAIPLIIMLGFLLVKKEGRESFKHAGIYIALISFLIVILPHVIWLFHNQFITIAYAFNRTGLITQSWAKMHLSYPIKFAFAQLLNFIFPVVLLILLKIMSTPLPCEKRKISLFDQQFILAMGLGPYLLTVILAMIFGWRLYNEWGVPLLSLWGLILVAFIQPKLTYQRFKKFLIILFIIMLLWPIGYAAGLYIDKKHTHSDNYPAQEIADAVTAQWWAQYHKPLKYVAGSRYIAGYIAFYSKDHPSVYVEWNQQFSPWINLSDLEKYGAVFIQDNYYGTTVFGDHPYTNNGHQFPPEVLQHFPNLQVQPIQYFYWHRAGDHLKPIPVLIGFLPPISDNSVQ